MAWNDMDVNDPKLYMPRNAPSVQRAARPSAPAKRGGEAETPAFLFDEDETWNEPLEELPTYRPQYSGSHGNTDPEAANPYAKRRAPVKSRAEGKRAVNAIPRGRPIAYAVVIIVCMAILAFIGVMMMPQMAGYFWKDLDNFAFINDEILTYDTDVVNNYKRYRAYMSQDVIFQGVFVDRTYVGGKTIAEAEALLGGDGSTKADAFAITVNIGNQTWNIDSNSIPAARNLDSVLKRAYAVGRQNTTDIIGTSKTPFRERVDTALDLMENYVYLESETTYDHDAVRAKVDEIAAYVTRDPIDAQIQTFDFNTRTFTFTDSSVGVAIDSDALYDQIIAKLDAGATHETIVVDPILTEPAVTKAQLASNFKMIAAFTTDTTSSSSRNNNIDLACQAVNGTVVMPGETFSFNSTTGERTRAKGYKEAGAISGGELVQQVGGGVCQASTTLFNAVVRSDLGIEERSPHAWPSTYVNIGEDATVDWPNLDFKFKNTKSTPVFLIMYYKNRKCSAEVWGMTLGDGVSINLSSTITKKTNPSSEVLYVQNSSLPAGTSEQTVSARTGYVVDTYAVWYKNGEETKRDKLYTSTYRAYQRTVEYN